MIQKSKNRKILIADDEESMLRALTDTFKSAEFDVFGAKNGEEGLEIAFREHPDVILIDILMPKMDGMTMLKKLREDEWGKNIPVMILTNLSDVEKIAEAVEDGICNYLVKTEWSLEEIVKKVNKLLKDRPVC
jgi:DNA-binding response OmpR family regulator